MDIQLLLAAAIGFGEAVLFRFHPTSSEPSYFVFFRAASLRLGSRGLATANQSFYLRPVAYSFVGLSEGACLALEIVCRGPHISVLRFGFRLPNLIPNRDKNIEAVSAQS
jgi:hypothetical protein